MTSPTRTRTTEMIHKDTENNLPSSSSTTISNSTTTKVRHLLTMMATRTRGTGQAPSRHRLTISSLTTTNSSSRLTRDSRVRNSVWTITTSRRHESPPPQPTHQDPCSKLSQMRTGVTRSSSMGERRSRSIRIPSIIMLPPGMELPATKVWPKAISRKSQAPSSTGTTNWRKKRTSRNKNNTRPLPISPHPHISSSSSLTIKGMDSRMTKATPSSNSNSTRSKTNLRATAQTTTKAKTQATSKLLHSTSSSSQLLKKKKRVFPTLIL